MKQCKKCGYYAEDNVKFCPQCGGSMERKEEMTNAVLKVGAVPQKEYYIRGVNLIAAVIFTVICLLQYNEYSRYSWQEEAATAFLLLAVIGLLDLVALACTVYNFRTKMKVVACEQRISGMAFKLFGLQAEGFDLPYEDIIGVSYRKQCLTIVTKVKSYVCLVDDAKGFYELIVEKSHLSAANI